MPDFSSARVLVIGDVMLDRYWHGEVSRISPEAPVPVVQVVKDEYRPGGAANVALNLAALGAQVNVVGLTGEDHNAELLENRLKTNDVGAYLLKTSASPTISKLRVLGRNQQIIRADFEDGFPAFEPAMLCDHIEPLWEKCSLVVFPDYAKGCLRHIETLIQHARQRDKKILVDPKDGDFGRYCGADIVTPNAAEFRAAVGAWKSEEELADKARLLAETNDLQGLLITQGKNGMSWVPAQGRPLHIPTEAREVFDVSGAGDTVIAVMAASLAIDMPIHQAIVLANRGAGIVVGKQGTATVSVAELFPQPSSLNSVSLDELKRLVLRARSQGERIVMTNGCFDVLHAGHIHCLEQAKELGDRLIVAINSDASVTRLKGEGRPLNPLKDRVKMISALRYVDWVIVFGDDGDDSPESMYAELLPDVLVKGGEYDIAEIAGAQAVINNGGEVVTVPMMEGKSTTAAIDRMKR